MSKLTREQIQEEARTAGHQRLRGENFRSANLSELNLQDSDLGGSDRSIFPWDDDKPPRIPLHESIIYEVG